ncbi:cytochrome P450 [Microbispora amethystogenes]|uniref:cytochrome P450 n=1 Tax=Microbispora amethystogenes TaxID=1427754 RepID=UPI001954B133|nr:cytochrome P450 [Microbispora amethystogenes]
MTSEAIDIRPPARSLSLPLRRTIRPLLRDPVNMLAGTAQRARGKVVRLNLGPFRPYLVSHPDHVQQVLRGDWENHPREGAFWKPVERLAGRSILTEGPDWESSRRILQPLFTSRYVASLTQDMAETIDEELTAWEAHARAGRWIDVCEELGRLVSRTVIRVLFGDKISVADAERLAPAYGIAATSFTSRLLMPFAPEWVPMPGDRAFKRAAEVIDDVVLPLVRQARRDPGDGNDIISALARARRDEDDPSAERRIRDDLVSIYGSSSETTAVALTWLWPLLHDHPEVAARLYDEVETVVGHGPVDPSCLPRLTYMKSVFQEMLRLYPPGWMIPRMARRAGLLGDVPIEPGATLLISPYVTHRLEEFWERPNEFDPERFAVDQRERRHRYAYFPFGGGPHLCLGQHLFYVEAPLIVAGILARFRPRVRAPRPLTPFPGASMRPKETVEVRLDPVAGGAGA